MDNVVEGVNATQAALVLAKELDVEMPIAEMASRVLFDGLSNGRVDVPAGTSGAVTRKLSNLPRPQFRHLLQQPRRSHPPVTGISLRLKAEKSEIFFRL